MRVHAGQEQLFPGQLHVVRDTDIADVAAEASGPDGLHRRLLRTDGLDHRADTEPTGSSLMRAAPSSPRSPTAPAPTTATVFRPPAPAATAASQPAPNTSEAAQSD